MIAKLLAVVLFCIPCTAQVVAVRAGHLVGLVGDMIAVPENPLRNIYTLRKVNFVMKDGQIIRRP